MTEFGRDEIQLLTVALRFWRAQRRDGAVRRTDPPIASETLQVVLAKLEAALNADGRPADGPEAPADLDEDFDDELSDERASRRHGASSASDAADDRFTRRTS